ncbi:PadR family transcriptional regulator [Mycobacterium paraseoulense]|uniref:PadR family transcriptional regulator n=2 Tax=Mycobacterium paraseoulense TaxID=590652 RepID=A0A1X0IDP3_9MYCO|nr:PadR family transcriptional regulator [Mycobacterium paraseoulense]ORB42972.1 PadR family transcriptional regulator [Mycobacterium paraseoulense]
MVSQPTATSFALLGLLGIQPWTAYELVAQAKRSLHHFWPRSEAHLYAELKRLVERGHAHAELIEGRRRQRTRYTITPAGRVALEDWLGTEPAPPVLEIEGLLRVLLADQGSVKELRAAVETTARQAHELLVDGTTLLEDLLARGGQFPQRLHLTERSASLYGEFILLLNRWCEETLAEVDTWRETSDVGMTPGARQRLERLLARAREGARSEHAVAVS